MLIAYRADGHLVSFDIPRVALQKTKYVIDNGLGGLMWWAVDEDWVEAAPEPQQATKRHLERKKKRSCKCPETPVDIGYVHAVDPLASTSSLSVSAVSMNSSTIGATSSVSATESSSTSASASSSASSVSASISSASSSSAAPLPSSSNSEAEGEQDGIQLKIGRSLVQVAKEGFEKYAQGLDKSENVLGYATSGESSFLRHRHIKKRIDLA